MTNPSKPDTRTPFWHIETLGFFVMMPIWIMGSVVTNAWEMFCHVGNGTIHTCSQPWRGR